MRPPVGLMQPTVTAAAPAGAAETGAGGASGISIGAGFPSLCTRAAKNSGHAKNEAGSSCSPGEFWREVNTMWQTVSSRRRPIRP